MDSIERELQFGHIMSEFLPPRPFHSRQIPPVVLPVLLLRRGRWDSAEGTRSNNQSGFSGANEGENE